MRTAERPRPPRGPRARREHNPASAAAGAAGHLARRLAPCLLILALPGCGVAVDGTASPAVWGAGAGAAALLLGGTALGVRRVTARRLEKAFGRAARERDAQLEQSEMQLHGLAAERQMLLQERQELVRQLVEATDHQTELVRERDEASREHGELARSLDEVVHELDEVVRERDELQGSVDATFVNLAMRTLTLVERQLVLIESLEGREGDATQLESLFRLDHLATRMRRNSENMLLLAGLENSQRGRTAVSMLDVVRAAVSEIERYERVRIGFLASVRLSGAVADDTSHLLAELLENATAFSPPQDQVEVGGWLLDNGEVMVSVVDRGIGLPAERMRQLNEQLSEPVGPAPDRRDALLAGALTGRSMGLFVVARLARRHGMRVQLRENAQGGGVTAMVVLPREALLQDAVTTTDLDDQRQAERSITSAAEQARAAADSAASVASAVAAATAVAVATPQVEAPDTSDEAPALPRRKPSHARQPEPRPEPRPEPQSVERTDEHQRAQADGSPTARTGEEPAVAEAGPLTALGLPRRVPKGSGLPGTGEAPASGLRRVAAEPEHAAGQRGTGTSAEELRRRLGGFQSGLRQAGREPGRAEPPAAERPATTVEGQGR